MRCSSLRFYAVYDATHTRTVVRGVAGCARSTAVARRLPSPFYAPPQTTVPLCFVVHMHTCQQ